MVYLQYRPILAIALSILQNTASGYMFWCLQSCLVNVVFTTDGMHGLLCFYTIPSIQYCVIHFCCVVYQDCDRFVWSSAY